MKRRVVLLLAVVMLLAVVVAGAATAKEPVRGVQDMVVNYTDQCAPMTWFGTIEFDGDVYGMALYGVDSREVGQTLHYEETFTIFDNGFRFDNGTLICTPGEVLLSGYTEGVGTYPAGKFRSNGTVDDGDWSGIFEGIEGRRVHEDGVMKMVEIAPAVSVPGFDGNFRIN